MARHEFESPGQGSYRGRHRSGRRFGAKILGAAHRSGSHHLDDAGEEEAARWRLATSAVSDYHERIKGLKGMYIEGLQRLVQVGAYHPNAMRRLSHVNVLTAIVEGEDDPLLKRADAYVDVHGRFIAANTNSKEGVYVHEFAHKTLQIGAPNKDGRNMGGWGLFNEPIAERVRSDFDQVMDIDNDVKPAYGVHSRVMDKILGATGMTFYDITRIASGDDPVENYYQFRAEAMANTGGVDIVGWAQQSYVNYAAFYERQHPENRYVHTDAIYYAAGLVEQDLDAYLATPAVAYTEV